MHLTINSDGTLFNTTVSLDSGGSDSVRQMICEASPLGVRVIILTDSERYVLDGSFTISGEFIPLAP